MICEPIGIVDAVKWQLDFYDRGDGAITEVFCLKYCYQMLPNQHQLAQVTSYSS